MGYKSRIVHSDHGEMLNLTESARYLGVSRRRFRHIAPEPFYVQSGIYPFWPRRVLDVLPLCDDFDRLRVYERGKSCGKYLIGAMDDEQIRNLRNELTRAALGGPVREHSCGIEEHTAGMGLLESAKWLFDNCDCPSTPVNEEMAIVLEEFGVKLSFRTVQEARTFQEGVLSTVKGHVRARLAGMAPDEAREYVAFWGNGSYLSLLMELHPRLPATDEEHR